MENVLGQDPTGELVLPLEEYANQKNQEVSGAYQDAHTIFKDYSRFCTSRTNPMGETFLLGPEVAIIRDYNETILIAARELNRYNDNKKLATVQFATRLSDKGKPVLNMPYSIVVNGNITSADLRINPQGTFEITGNSIAELNRVEQIGKIADISLASVERRAKHRRRSLKGWLSAAVLASGLGITGYKVVHNVQEKAKLEEQKVAEFDNKVINFEHGVIAFGEEGPIVVPDFESEDVDFNQIPKYEDHESTNELRVHEVRTGTCSKIGTIGQDEQMNIANEPVYDSNVIAVTGNNAENSLNRVVFICVPEVKTYVKDGEDRVFYMRFVASVEHIDD